MFRISLVLTQFVICLNIVNSMHVSNVSELNLRDSTNRYKRFVNLDFIFSASGKKPQTCSISEKTTGFCKPVTDCLLNELKRINFGVVKNLCILENSLIGICCPNDGVSEKFGQDSSEDLITEETETPDITKPKSQTEGCGRKTDKKIVGGTIAGKKDWPWMAALMRTGELNFCGGVLITNRHVLSAAHCTFGLKPQDVIVRLGEYDFSTTNGSNSKDFKISSITEHPGYKDHTFKDDISILKLFRLVLFDEHIIPICLPLPDDSFANKTATVTGWGHVGFAEASSDILRQVNIPVWPQEECQSVFKEINVTETVICAGGRNERKDACQRDSGGPLMHRLNDQRWVTIGIVSWGLACGQLNKPGLYTRVNKYLTWIKDNSKDEL